MADDMDFDLPPEEGLDDNLAFTPLKEGEEKEITKDGAVKKLLVKAGEGWEKPEAGDDVTG